MLGTLSRASLATAKYTLENGQRLTGIVTSTHKMTATTTVTVERTMLHNITLKQFLQHKKYLVHDPTQAGVVGDLVSIQHCTPVSKRKHFQLIEILKRSRDRATRDVAAAPATLLPQA